MFLLHTKFMTETWREASLTPHTLLYHSQEFTWKLKYTTLKSIKNILIRRNDDF